MAEAAVIGDVFVTATGNRSVITGEHLAVMKDGAVLVNAGHFDVDVRALEKLASGRHERVRPHVDEYTLEDGRRVLLLAEGRVANRGGGKGIRRRSWTWPSPSRRCV